MNFFCHKVTERSPDRETLWLWELSGYYGDLTLKPDCPTNAYPRALDAEMVDVVCAIKPAVASFHFELPKTDFIDRIRKTNAKIIATVTTVEEALFLQDSGCDAMIAQGQEAGGHQGVFLPTETSNRLATSQLVARIANAVSIPTISASGIADQAGIKAMMAAGASTVQIGTLLLKSSESKITPLHRAILEGQSDREHNDHKRLHWRARVGYCQQIDPRIRFDEPKYSGVSFGYLGIASIVVCNKGV